MGMKLSQLIATIGDDNVQLQNLDQCAKTLDYHHKRGTTITFGTTMNIYAERGTERLGLVIWLDREAVKDALAQDGRE